MVARLASDTSPVLSSHINNQSQGHRLSQTVQSKQIAEIWSAASIHRFRIKSKRTIFHLFILTSAWQPSALMGCVARHSEFGCLPTKKRSSVHNKTLSNSQASRSRVHLPYTLGSAAALHLCQFSGCYVDCP